MAKKEMMTLLNINEGVGNTRMARKKYQIYREAILAVLAEEAQGLSLKELSPAVKARLPQDKLAELGKVTWHTVAVKLDLEARGEIERVPRSKPQRLRMRQSHDPVS